MVTRANGKKSAKVGEKTAKLDTRRANAWKIEKRAVVTNVRRELCDVYMGRPHPQWPGETGYFGNPIDNAKSMDDYIAYFIKRLVDDDVFRRRVESLPGKRLGCWCYPRPCHAMVIACWANLDPDDRKTVLDEYHQKDEGKGKAPEEWESVWALSDWAQEDKGA